jgi:hypothetical protein
MREGFILDFDAAIEVLTMKALEAFLKLDGCHVINQLGKVKGVALKIPDDLGGHSSITRWKTGLYENRL